MNAVAIEEAVRALAARPFDATEFPFAFLDAFGNKQATIKKLRAGTSNKSDLGGVLQVNHVPIKAAEPGAVHATLAALRTGPGLAEGAASAGQPSAPRLTPHHCSALGGGGGADGAGASARARRRRCAW